MWASLNRVLNLAFEVPLWLVQGLSASWQLVALALPAALFGLLVFRYTSDQRGIEAAKDRIVAHLLELLLFRDDFAVTLRSQGQILRHNVVYVRKALLPMAVMIGPFVLALVQIESRFAHRPLAPGESAVLVAVVEGEPPVSQREAILELPEGLLQETPPLRIDVDGEVLWRIAATQPGEHRVTLRLDGNEVDARVIVGDAAGPAFLATAALRADDPELLAYPAALPLPAGAGVGEIRLDYPLERGVFAGLSSASWLFMGATVLLGFALRRPLGVAF